MPTPKNDFFKGLVDEVVGSSASNSDEKDDSSFFSDLVKKTIGETTNKKEPTPTPTPVGMDVTGMPTLPDEVATQGSIFDTLRTRSDLQEMGGTLDPEEKRDFQSTRNQIRKTEHKLERMKNKTGLVPFEPAMNPIDDFIKTQFGNTWKVIEKFQIPQQMIFNTLKRIQDGDTDIDSIAEGIVNATKGVESTTSKQLWDKALDELADNGVMPKYVVEGIKENPAYKAINFGFDVALDPLLAVGSGETRLGKLSKLRTTAEEMGTGIKLDSKAAMDIADYYGAKTGTKEITKGVGEKARTIKVPVAPADVVERVPVLGQTTQEQLDLGQKALITVLGRPAFKGKAIYKAIDGIKDTVGRSKLIRDLRDAATNRTGIEKLDEILFRTRQAYNLADDEGRQSGLEIAKRIKDSDQEQINLISKVLDEGLDYEVVHDPKLRGKEIKKGLFGVSPEIGGVIGDMRNEFQLMRDAEISLDVLKSEYEHYFPRIITKEGLEANERIPVIDVKDESFNILPKSQALKFAKERSTREFSLDEFNQRQLNKLGVEEFFTKDPSVALAIRKSGSMKAMATAEMWDDISRRFSLDPSKAGYDKGFELKGIPRLQGMKFDKDVAEGIAKIHKVTTEVKKFDEIQNAWMQYTDWWKGWTLGVFPEYHFRNAASNYWNNSLVGVKNKDYFTGRKISKGMDGFVETVTGHKYPFDQIRKLAKTWGVEGTGWYGADIPEQLARVAKQGEDFSSVGKGFKTIFLSPAQQSIKGLVDPSRANYAMRLGFAVGKGIENNARMAHFVRRLVEGDSPAQASMSVAKYLFDYSDLTRWEKKLKPFFPFMKWTKQNVPLQVASLFKSPWKYTMVSKGREAFFEEGETFQALYPEIPDFIRENTPIRIRKSEDGSPEYFLFGGWWPASDLQKILGPQETMISLLNPAAQMGILGSKKILEFASPRAAREFEIEQKRPVRFMGVKMTRQTARQLRTFRLANTFDRFVQYSKELEAEKDRQVLGTSPLVRTLIGLKTFRTNPARDAMFYQKAKAEEMRRKLKDLEIESKETQE